mmetsp:Transcript_45395/g.147540  ORF Transcript_45395/g.147540 Transcript_45395/m.147540 type:complete len:350 (+) Transcript_45395:150-1199(+)
MGSIGVRGAVRFFADGEKKCAIAGLLRMLIRCVSAASKKSRHHAVSSSMGPSPAAATVASSHSLKDAWQSCTAASSAASSTCAALLIQPCSVCSSRSSAVRRVMSSLVTAQMLSSLSVLPCRMRSTILTLRSSAASAAWKRRSISRCSSSRWADSRASPSASLVSSSFIWAPSLASTAASPSSSRWDSSWKSAPVRAMKSCSSVSTAATRVTAPPRSVSTLATRVSTRARRASVCACMSMSSASDLAIRSARRPLRASPAVLAAVRAFSSEALTFSRKIWNDSFTAPLLAPTSGITPHCSAASHSKRWTSSGSFLRLLPSFCLRRASSCHRFSAVHSTLARLSTYQARV